MNDLSASLSKSIKRGVDWLLTRQKRTSGAWHSETYGAMRGGASITSLVLYTASHLPKKYYDSKAWDRGLSFLLPGIEKKACIACPDGTLDYPTYSTAMTLVATRQLGLKLEASHRTKLIDYLVGAQLTEQNGFMPSQPDYGGWDLIGASGATGVTSGTNISVSFHAVEAIAGEESTAKADALRFATEWCHRCQNYREKVGDDAGDDSDSESDGGFFFHPERKAFGNKAQWSDDDYNIPRSYGTATCDGIRLLLAAGAKKSDPRVRAGIHWLSQNEAADRVPGFEDAPEELGWAEGLKFYYFAGLSRALKLLGEAKKERAAKLATIIVDLQKEDGRWQNDSARMREDDELIASCFALMALSSIYHQLPLK